MYHCLPLYQKCMSFSIALYHRMCITVYHSYLKMWHFSLAIRYIRLSMHMLPAPIAAGSVSEEHVLPSGTGVGREGVMHHPNWPGSSPPPPILLRPSLAILCVCVWQQHDRVPHSEGHRPLYCRGGSAASPLFFRVLW